MTEILDLEYIDNKLINADPEFMEEYDLLVERMYLGTVFEIYPSGKYYTPFANSNVTKDEVKKDEAFLKQIELELDTIGAYLVSGDGDPTDLFIEREIDTS